MKKFILLTALVAISFSSMAVPQPRKTGSGDGSLTWLFVLMAQPWMR